MSVIGHSPLAGASGAAGSGGGEGLYVDDLFSTFLHTGTGSTQSINNGIDLSGEGGLVWIKNRSTSNTYHALFDTERGTERYLNTNAQNAEYYYANNGVTSFNSNGFTVKGTSDWWGAVGEEIVSWTFRKAPKFFDVVTYTGTGSVQNISHSLGSVPGMILIHCRDGTHDWELYHRATGATKSLHINVSNSQATDSTVWNNTTPTSSVFTVGTSSNVNQNGHGYVAYIFGHGEQVFGANGNESIIECGSYTGNSTAYHEINVGFEPEFLLFKNVNSGNNYYLFDTMRGFTADPVNDEFIWADRADAANSQYSFMYPTPTGFGTTATGGGANSSGNTYIYMAIRRPHKPPTAGTEVFDLNTRTNTSPNLFSTALLYVDANWNRYHASGDWMISNRLMGTPWLVFNRTQAESVGTNKFDYNYKVRPDRWTSGTESNYLFKRASGFFDVVTYKGTGSAKTIDHNLQAIPELIIVKNRDYTYNWAVYAQAFGRTKYLYLNLSDSIYTASAGTFWGTSDFTSTQFFLGNYGNTNSNTHDHIAYLFATLDGISKVGSYTGTGYDINVDCGFTAGARFVLIKRTDSSGDWYVWDTVRGIVSGNDPYLLVNSNAAPVTNTDYIDPLNAGFTVTSSAPAALNTSGGTYLFLAIA